jgi:hypothetical protein
MKHCQQNCLEHTDRMKTNSAEVDAAIEISGEESPWTPTTAPEFGNRQVNVILQSSS